METPCNNICIIDPVSGLCRGCGRTTDEIAGWSTMSDAGRRAVMATLRSRMQAAGLPPADARPG